MSIVISNLTRLSLRNLVRRFEFPTFSEKFCEMGRNMTINAINTTINSSHLAHESGKSDRSIFAVQNFKMERFSGVSLISAAFNPFHFAHLSGTIWSKCKKPLVSKGVSGMSSRTTPLLTGGLLQVTVLGLSFSYSLVWR